MRRWLLAPSPFAYALLALLHALLIYRLSAIPGDRIPSGGASLRVLANFCHAPLYFGLGFLVSMAVAARPAGAVVLGWKRIAVGVTICFGYAVFDEWHQSRVRGRSPDILDIVTDVAGIVAAVTAARLLGAGAVPRSAARLGFGLLFIVAVASSWLGAR